MSAHHLLTDRTIIVTGGATGIGQAFAVGSAAQGANADLNDLDQPRNALGRATGEMFGLDDRQRAGSPPGRASRASCQRTAGSVPAA